MAPKRTIIEESDFQNEHSKSADGNLEELANCFDFVRFPSRIWIAILLEVLDAIAVQIPLALLHLVRILCDRRLSNIYYSNIYYSNILLLPFTVATEKSLGYLP